MANEVKFTFRVVGENLEVFDQAGAKLKTISTEAKKTEREVTSSFAGIEESAKKLGVAVGAALVGVGTAAALAVRHAINTQDEINKISQSANIATRELSALRVVAELNDLSIQQMGQAMGFFNRQLVEASDKTSKQAAVLKALGVTAREPLAALLQVADAFKGLGASSERTAAASALFGRGMGANLIPALAAGSAGIREMIEEAEALGVTFDESAGLRADEFNDNLTRLKLAVDGLANQVAIALTPALVDVTNATVEWAKANSDVIATDLKGWADALVNVISTRVIPFLQSTKQEFELIAKAVDAVVNAPQRAVNQRLGLPGDQGTLFGATGGPSQSSDDITAAIRGVAADGTNAAARRRAVAGALSGGGGGDGTSGAANAAKQAAKDAADLEKRTLETIKELEEQRLAILDRQTMLREAQINYAEQDLRLAQQAGASEQEQLAIAERLDLLERERLEAMRDRLQAEIDGIQAVGPVVSAELEGLRTEMELVNTELARGPEHVRELQDEFKRAKDVVIDLGAELNTSIKRVIDGILAGGRGGFNIGDIFADTGRTLLSSIVGGGLQSLIQGGELKIEGLEKFTNLFQSVIGRIGGLFGGGQAAPLGVDAAGQEIAGPPQQAGGGAGAAFAGATAGAAIALQASLAAVDAMKALQRSVTLLNTITTQDLQIAGARAGFGTVGLSSLGGIVGQTPWQARAAISSIFNPLGLIFDNPWTNQAPSLGAQRRQALAKLWAERNLPQQQMFELGGHGGIRTQFLEALPDEMAAAAFEAAGFGRGVPGLRQSPLTVIERTAEQASGIRAQREAIQAGAAARPEVEALRAGEALALGVILTRDLAGGSNVANALTSNLLLLGVSAEEAKRQLRALAEEAGINLVNGIEELQRLYIEGIFKDDPTTAENEKQKQLFTTVEGLVDLFTDDLPAGVNVAAIATRNFTEQAGIDIANFNEELERSLAIFGQLQATQEAGLRGGLGTALGSFGGAARAIGQGDVATAIRLSTRGRNELRDAIALSVSQGLAEAFTSSAFNTIKDSPAFDALNELVAGAVTGGSLADLPARIDDVVKASVPVLEAYAQTFAAIEEATKEIVRTAEITAAIQQGLGGGLRGGIVGAAGSFAEQESLIQQALAGGTVRVTDIVGATEEARRAFTSGLMEGIAQAMTEGLVTGLEHTIRNTPEWAALESAIKAAVENGTAIDPTVIANLVGAALPQIQATAEAFAQVRSQFAVTPFALGQQAAAFQAEIDQRRLEQLSPRRRRSFLGGELAGIEAQLANPGLDAATRRELLEEKFRLGGQLADEATSRSQFNRAIGIQQAATDALLELADQQQEAIDHAKATADNTAKIITAVNEGSAHISEAIRAVYLTERLTALRPILGKPESARPVKTTHDVTFHIDGGNSDDQAMIRNMVRTEVNRAARETEAKLKIGLFNG